MGNNTWRMGRGASKATTPAAGEGATGTGGTGGTGHANIARSGISGRGAGGHAPKAKTMSRTHFESKIGKVGFDKADDDKSGKLSDKEWAELFESIDTDGDGVVDQMEWEV